MDDLSHSSVSDWLRGLENGDIESARHLWDRYFEKLVRQAENRLRNCPPGGAGAEDIAASVIESIWRAAQEGRLSDVKDRDELWWLLLALTRRKVASHVRRESAQKRGGAVSTKSFATASDGGYTFEELVSAEPSAEYVQAMDEECSRLLGLLRDDLLRRIAVLKLEGFTNTEISERCQIAPATVTRKVRLIRTTWAREIEL